ncbi:hypothetical protein QP441_10915, partial [Corynebacterium amycolatum]
HLAPSTECSDKAKHEDSHSYGCCAPDCLVFEARANPDVERIGLGNDLSGVCGNAYSHLDVTVTYGF